MVDSRIKLLAWLIFFFVITAFTPAQILAASYGNPQFLAESEWLAEHLFDREV